MNHRRQWAFSVKEYDIILGEQDYLVYSAKGSSFLEAWVHPRLRTRPDPVGTARESFSHTQKISHQGW
jgi:hypothetical protein